ncbi:MAG: hypothetical protein ACJA06_000272 [Halocynthiibacter sp.]|jgi:hypothetical protein
MRSSFTRILTGTAFGIFVSASAAPLLAQDSTNVVAENTAWYVFEENAPKKQCWAVSSPKETINTDSSGRIKAVRRGEIMLFVSYAPENGVKGQVSFAGGYPFAGGSEVTMDIGGTVYKLFTDGETAWSASPADDAKLIAAMKRGATATLTASSARGTVTKDTFSLSGFTASVEDAGKRCGS